MSYNIELSPTFQKEAKRLAKKYNSLKSDLIILFEDLKQNPNQGTALGNDVYKIRFSISSKGKGKSGGARIISYVKIVEETVYLLSIYNKGNTDSLSDKEIQDLLSNYV
jgi:mRNA-degrading endonuclease RelE of RelBE toxin-antitoxin system